MRHAPRRAAFAVSLLVPLALSPASPEGAAAPRCEGPAVPLPRVCGADLAPVRVDCTVPVEVDGALSQPSFNVRQRASDLFSWQSMIGLHWPAARGERGVPAADRPLGAPGPRVWETWKESTEVFRHRDGLPLAPEPWEAPPPPPPAACATGARSAEAPKLLKLLTRDEKVDDLFDAVIQPTYADGSLPGTLTDLHGRAVRYEIRLNRTAFEYIVTNRLWDGMVQQTVDEVSFPPGSVLVKAAWREVEPDEAESFVATEACICAEGGRDCRRRRVGLVGFHVMSKTRSAPQWIWSTFEHVANVAPAAGLPASFFDPGCVDCANNRQGPAGFRNQVTRLVPIPDRPPDCADPTAAVDDVAALNRDVRRALESTGSPLASYELVNTQWPYRPAGTPDDAPSTVFEVAPPLLGNTTLETYIQRSSSCMGCHALAATQRLGEYVSADFSFTLNAAWPHPFTDATSPPPDVVPRDPRALPAPAGVGPKSGWDREHWSGVVTGHRLTTATYELLPELVGNRLHCGSCHLGAGGDPAAAWWVGMRTKYDWPATDQLEQRINRCFERSMNGTAPCATSADTGADTGEGSPGTCAGDPTMDAFITYMTWLDEQWQARHPHGGELPNGFPVLPERVGDTERGASVFLQKCAFCHRSDGGGRYESGVYYRPAVVGPDSYNVTAGMGKVATLAAFLHANMPYGYGGSLTVEEAWDVACWVDAQPRPGYGGGTPEGCR
jgi:cytochrome c